MKKLSTTIFLLFSFCLLFAEETPILLINTLPKSGSMFISKTMDQHLSKSGCRFVRVSDSTAPIDFLNEERILSVKGKEVLTQEHLDASEENLALLKKYIPKFLLHVRDPRQSLISWYHHVDQVKREHEELWYENIRPPKGYFWWSRTKKMDWMIENFLPTQVAWLEGWKKALENQDLDIMLTRFEDMQQDPQAYFEEVYAFFGKNIEGLELSAFKSKNKDLHQRKGEVNEWERVLTPRQKKRVSQLVPQELLEYYGWN